MKKQVVLCGLFIFCINLQLQAQWGTLGGRIKDELSNKAQQKIENEINNGADKAYEKTKNSVKEGAKNSNNKPSSSKATTSTNNEGVNNDQPSSPKAALQPLLQAT